MEKINSRFVNLPVWNWKASSQVDHGNLYSYTSKEPCKSTAKLKIPCNFYNTYDSKYCNYQSFEQKGMKSMRAKQRPYSFTASIYFLLDLHDKNWRNNGEEGTSIQVHNEDAHICHIDTHKTNAIEEMFLMYTPYCFQFHVLS